MSRRPAVGRFVAVIVALVAATLVVPVTARAAVTVPNPDPSLIARWEPCQPDTGVTVTVDFSSLGDHKVYVGCALGDQPSGADAMKNAGFTIAGTKQYGENFICRINNLPGPAQQDCLTTPGGLAYWSYWIADKPNGIWGYSSVGAKDPSNRPRKGTFQGWSFSTADGRTVLPRVPPIDSRGADVHNPAPLPTSTAAATLATDWLNPVLDNATSAGNATNHLAPATAATLLRALAGVDLDRTARARLAAVLRNDIENYVTGGDVGRLYSADTANALLALHALNDPADSGLIGSLAQRLTQLMYPSGAAYPAGTFEAYHTENATFDNGFGGLSGDQPRIVEALLAADGSVPAAAIDWLLSTQAANGEIVPRTCGDDGISRCDGAGPVFSVTPTVQFIDALTEVERAGSGAIEGGGIMPATIRDAIARAGRFLLDAQQPDGGYVGNYPSGPRSQGLATTWTTAQAARGLAKAGQGAAARRAARWLAAMQFTTGAGAPAALLGDVPADSNYFTSQAANGLGDDPRTTTDAAVVDYLYSTELPAVIEALRAWRAAPFRDAEIVSSPVEKLMSTSATVTVGLQPGTDDQQVTVAYGTLGANRTRSGPVDVKAGPSATAAGVVLDGLQPTTTYTYQVTSSGGGASTTGEVGTFTTAQAAGNVGHPDLPAGVHYLTAPARLIEGTHYQPGGPDFTDFGLTMDAAFALAATGTADRTLARITAYVASRADTYTGIGTKDASGGAIAKQALLAEVTGHDPRKFGGHDLIAALGKLVCSRADTAGCAAAGNYRYAQSVFGQALGVIAQKRAHDETVARPAAYLRGLQQPSGAFPSVVPGNDSEVDSTAMAAMALDLLPGAANAGSVRRALTWLAAQQLGDGGFPGAAGDSTNSAGLAIQGLSLDAALYRSEIARAQTFLAARQNADGGFEIAAGARIGSDVRASAQAVSGSAAVSFGTLRRNVVVAPPPSASAPPATGPDHPEGRRATNSRPADTGIDLTGLLGRAALLLAVGGVALLAGRPRGRRVS